MKYLALLRGINVGGNNKVAMSDLRTCFESLGFTHVSTYINSGNIFFETKKTSEPELVERCEQAIEKTFGFSVVVTVISKDEYIAAIDNAPKWWGKEDRKLQRSDALFVIPPTKTSEVRQILEVKADKPDRFDECGHVVFWTLPMADYNKSVVPKIIGTPIYRRITIRSSTTTRKLYDLFTASD